jgi:hypothetical protein
LGLYLSQMKGWCLYGFQYHCTPTQAQYYDQYWCNLTGMGLLVNIFVLYTAQFCKKQLFLPLTLRPHGIWYF